MAQRDARKAEIASIIRRARVSAGMTQARVAEMLGVTAQAISNFERGINSIEADLLFRMCEIYDLDYRSVFVGSDSHEKRELTREEKMHLEKYQALDSIGREAVDAVLDVEYRRVTAPPEPQREDEAEGKIIRFTVPQYQEPMSAGYGDEIGVAYAENIELIREPPRGTSFIARVHGDSMEPDYHDGDWVFVHAQNEILIGQVGVFYMDGREWIKELGEGELISRKSEKYGPKSFSDDIRCQGLVLGICDDSYFEK